MAGEETTLRIDSSMMPSNFGGSLRLYMIESNKLLLDTGFTARSASETAGEAAQGVQQAINDSGTALSGVTTLNQAVDALDNAIVAIATDYVSYTKTAVQSIASPFQAVSYRVNGVQVIGARVGGFTAPAGVSSKAQINADAGYNVGGEYDQGQVQAIATGLVQVRKLVAALQEALISHGVIGV